MSGEIEASWWGVWFSTNDLKARRAATILHAAMSEAGFPRVRATAIGPYDLDPDNSVTLGYLEGPRAARRTGPGMP